MAQPDEVAVVEKLYEFGQRLAESSGTKVKSETILSVFSFMLLKPTGKLSLRDLTFEDGSVRSS